MSKRAVLHELSYSWPAIPFAAALVCAFVHAFGVGWAQPVGLVLLVGAFCPCCLIRDWWVGRRP